MIASQEITNAVAAHGKWKVRLKEAIATGKIDTAVETIRANDQCPFGKWLHGPTLTAADKHSEHYKTVMDLHTRFHKAAAEVAALATAGKKAEAEAKLSIDSEFSKISATLTTAMVAWQKSLTPTPVH